MFLPQTDSDLALFKELNQIHYYWIPIYWQKGKWLELESSQKASFLPWWPGEPNGRENEPCVCLSMHQQAFHDASCTREFYFVCQFQGPPTKFILRGLKGTKIDFQYILRLDLRFNDQFVFQGLSHSHFIFTNFPLNMALDFVLRGILSFRSPFLILRFSLKIKYFTKKNVFY